MSREKRPSRPVPPISVRLQELFSRLERHPPFASFAEAYAGLVTILDAVEDELTGILNDPPSWETDGRLYPPQQDHWFSVPGWPGVTRMRTRAHNVFVAENGAMEIQEAKTGVVFLSKPGADGKEAWDDE
jgi:hypothetical protein